MSSHNSVTLPSEMGQPDARPGTQGVRTISVQRDMPAARLTNLQLASKLAWHTRRALNATGANKALYDARARLALRYWLRAHGHVLEAL